MLILSYSLLKLWREIFVNNNVIFTYEGNVRKVTDFIEWVMEGFSEESPFRMSGHFYLEKIILSLDIGLY